MRKTNFHKRPQTLYLTYLCTSYKRDFQILQTIVVDSSDNNKREEKGRLAVKYEIPGIWKIC